MTMSVQELLCIVVLVALLASTIVLLLKKWGLAEWMQVHGDKVLSELFSCDLCMTFWAGTLVWIVLACIFDNPMMVLCGFLSCPISRMMV